MGIFDEMAARYDTGERVRMAEIIAGALRERVAGCRGKAAVDYGCGTGLVGLRLAGCFGSLLMVDASPQMIEQVKRKLAAAQPGNVAVLCANFATGIPAGLSADIILMVQTLLHIPDVPGILRRLYGLLNPGGRLLVADFNWADDVPSDRVHNGFDQTELTTALMEIGFAAARAETFYHGKGIFMGRDASMFILDAEKAR